MKSAFILILLFSTFTLSAQYQKGNWYLSGDSNAELVIPLNGGESSTPGYLSVAARRLGYFVTNRFLVGASTFFYVGEETFSGDGPVRLTFQPYVRYYFSSDNGNKPNFFADASIGSFSVLGQTDFYSANHSFGGGAELQLAPGLVATAALRYYNFDNVSNNTIRLDIGANVLLGQLEKQTVTLRKGLVTSRAILGNLSYNRIGLDGLSLEDFNINLNPEFGYFLNDRLQLSVALILSSTFGSRSGLSSTSQSSVSIARFEFSFSPRLRYYLRGGGRLLPFVYAGASYNTDSFLSEGVTGRLERVSALNNYGLEGGLGASYFLSPAIAFEGRLLLEALSSGNNFDEVRSGTSRLRLNCGFQFYFDRFVKTK